MNRTLQPLALVIGIGVLTVLRLIIGHDPISEVIDSFLRREQVIDIDNSQVQNQVLEERIALLENELGFKKSSKFDLTPANIINKTSVSFRQLIKIDRGSADGLNVDQPVMSGGYLIGLTIEVNHNTATVLLLGDPDLNIPVVTNGADGIARAKAGGIVISELNDNHQATAGQTVVTSGLGGLYPPGLPVGSLGARLSSEILGEFVLSRPFNLSQLRIVMVVTR